MALFKEKIFLPRETEAPRLVKGECNLKTAWAAYLDPSLTGFKIKDVTHLECLSVFPDRVNAGGETYQSHYLMSQSPRLNKKEEKEKVS